MNEKESRVTLLLADVARKVAHGEITEAHLQELLREPARLNPPRIEAPVTEDDPVGEWMQGVYRKLGVPTVVPPFPKLTKKQQRGLKKFGLQPIYLPAITEDFFPASFRKPDWGYNASEEAKCIDRFPLAGTWVAIEMFDNAHAHDLFFSKPLSERCGLTYDAAAGLLVDMARTAGFPARAARIPSFEERNFIANVFHQLRERNIGNIPRVHWDASLRHLEWCRNVLHGTWNKEREWKKRIIADGLTAVRTTSNLTESFSNVGFRAIFDL